MEMTIAYIICNIVSWTIGSVIGKAIFTYSIKPLLDKKENS